MTLTNHHLWVVSLKQSLMGSIICKNDIEIEAEL